MPINAPKWALGVKGIRSEKKINDLITHKNWQRFKIGEPPEPCTNLELLKAVEDDLIDRVFERHGKAVVVLDGDFIYYEQVKEG